MLEGPKSCDHHRQQIFVIKPLGDVLQYCLKCKLPLAKWEVISNQDLPITANDRKRVDTFEDRI